MEPVEDAPRCANQMHVRESNGAADPTLVCSCAAGLVHMHDCPVSMGLPCVHFRDAEPDVCSRLEWEKVHDRLMMDYLTRPYYHRIHSLAPAGDGWNRRREELYAFYATVELDEAEFGEHDEEEYARERERLLVLRRKREEARKEREERSREERAQERARLGIKTVVEKAQEAVASQGNIASSLVDDKQLPAKQPRRKRRRRRGRDGVAAAKSAPEAPKADGGEPRKRRRRRRRRRGGGGGAAASA